MQERKVVGERRVVFDVVEPRELRGHRGSTHPTKVAIASYFEVLQQTNWMNGSRLLVELIEADAIDKRATCKE